MGCSSPAQRWEMIVGRKKGVGLGVYFDANRVFKTLSQHPVSQGHGEHGIPSPVIYFNGEQQIEGLGEVVVGHVVVAAHDGQAERRFRLIVASEEGV